MTSNRRALVIGVESTLESARLPSARTDAEAIAELLRQHGTDGAPTNWDVTPLIEKCGAKHRLVYTQEIQEQITTLLMGADVDEHSERLFYFSGHGVARPWGAELLAHNGVSMSFNDIMALVNMSTAKSITIILDCCLSGAIGNEPLPEHLDLGTDPFRPDRAVIREGLSILTASRPAEPAMQIQNAGKRPVGAFTEMLISGLRGAAADLLGNITAIDLYDYAAAGFVDGAQRPTFKSHVTEAIPIRRVQPQIPLKRLRAITGIFVDGKPKQLTKAHDHDQNVDGSRPRTGKKVRYEPFTGSAEQCELDHIKMYRNMGLVTTCDADRDLWDVCMDGGSVRLTGLGRYYWSLAQRGLLK